MKDLKWEIKELKLVANDTARTPKERDDARNKMYELEMKEVMNRKYELEQLLLKLGDIEIELIDEEVLEDGDEFSDMLGDIKETLYKKIQAIK